MCQALPRLTHRVFFYLFFVFSIQKNIKQIEENRTMIIKKSKIYIRINTLLQVNNNLSHPKCVKPCRDYRIRIYSCLLLPCVYKTQFRTSKSKSITGRWKKNAVRRIKREEKSENHLKCVKPCRDFHTGVSASFAGFLFFIKNSKRCRNRERFRKKKINIYKD